MYQNVVIGFPLVEPWELLAYDKDDWEQNEEANTLFTETRYLPTVMKEAGLVQSTREVKRNRPDLCKALDEIGCIDLKWGKKRLYIVVGSKDKVEHKPYELRKTAVE